jgi:hypothetical protein
MQTKLFLAFLSPEISEEVARLSRECSISPSELCRFAMESMLPKIRSGEVTLTNGKLHSVTESPLASMGSHHE